MNRLVGLKQFEITRGALLKFMETLDDKTVDTQPEGFNNTIRWHIGHVLTAQLKEQAKRINEIPAEAFENKLPEPFLGLETVGELYGMMLYHEADYIGQMKAMERIIKAL
ncbi:DinB family protein [Bacillus thuringiensis]|nr:DinB family protein [Bacillus thuringiensis]